MKRLIKILAVLVAAIAFTGDSPGQGGTIEDVSPAQIDLIHYGDVVDVDVVGSLDFDWRGGLTPEGFLDGLDKAREPVYALCRSEADVAASVASEYSAILRSPKVVVRILDRSNRALAYVVGAVRNQQRFQIRRPVRLAELIIQSGGITDRSNGEILILRPPNVNCQVSQKTASGTALTTMTVKIADLLSGNKEANPQILTGDMVTVVESAPVFIMGRDGTERMNLTPDLTLSRALTAKIAGLSKLKKEKVRIYRRRGEQTMLELDLGPILDGSGDDPKLQPYDVVEIADRNLAVRKLSPFEEPASLNSAGLGRLPLRIVD